MCVSVAQAVLGFLVFSYAAYSFFVVSVNTAAGNDEIQWPGDPIQDWLWNAWYLGWLAAVWAAPVSLIAGLVKAPPSLFLPIIIAGLWLIFPLTVLSSLSALSRFVVFRPTVAWSMMRHPVATFGFYLSTGILLVLSVGLFYFGVTRSPGWLPLAAIVGAAAFLIYARLLGRLGWFIAEQPARRKTRSRRPNRAMRAKISVSDPWSFPEDEPRAGPEPDTDTDESPVSQAAKANDRLRAASPAPTGEDLTGRYSSSPDDPLGPVEGTYELLDEPLPRSPRPETVEEADPHLNPYGISPAGVEQPAELAPSNVSLWKFEEKLAPHRVKPALPSFPLISGVYGFPFYPATLLALIVLGLGLMAMTALLRVQLALSPF
jgi:hypothetical protein